eukprot:14999409-Ditylum_brightwellii.AAC.1
MKVEEEQQQGTAGSVEEGGGKASDDGSIGSDRHSFEEKAKEVSEEMKNDGMHLLVKNQLQ